jgi:hypothetical protein
MTTSADGSQVPTQVTSGFVQDTSEDVPVQPHGAPISDPGEAIRNPFAGEVNKLNNFLMTAFPNEMNRSNLTVPETPVDVAIRLLKGLSVVGGGTRCPVEYCNLPINHDGEHGFISFTPR